MKFDLSATLKKIGEEIVKLECKWNEEMKLTAEADQHAVAMDAKPPVGSFHVEADATTTEGVYPAVFKEVRLVFKLKGELDAERVLESVRLSQTQYCGVSAMVSFAVPIFYSVELNGKNIGSGHADFK